MLNKIEYYFVTNVNPFIQIKVDWIWKEKESNDPYLLNTELNQLWSYDIREIVSKLEEVSQWRREKFIFWFETTLIWCYQKWKWYYGEKYPNSEVTITYNYADDYIVTDLKIEDILHMMRDWSDYIDAWEKETWKTKGWPFCKRSIYNESYDGDIWIPPEIFHIDYAIVHYENQKPDLGFKSHSMQNDSYIMDPHTGFYCEIVTNMKDISLLYIQEIISLLEDVKEWDKNVVEFYIGMIRFKVSKKHLDFIWVIWLYKEDIKIDFDNFYEMLRDRRDWIEKWEKETEDIYKQYK